MREQVGIVQHDNTHSSTLCRLIDVFGQQSDDIFNVHVLIDTDTQSLHDRQEHFPFTRYQRARHASAFSAGREARRQLLEQYGFPDAKRARNQQDPARPLTEVTDLVQMRFAIRAAKESLTRRRKRVMGQF